jgi:hypothetical protein
LNNLKVELSEPAREYPAVRPPRELAGIEKDGRPILPPQQDPVFPRTIGAFAGRTVNRPT